MVVKIETSAWDEIRKHAEEGYPNEVCGVLVGRNGHVSAARRCRNINTERARDRYELDPLSFLEADTWARRNGMEIVGIYHSHPDHPSRPSETDLRRAWQGWVYVIVSINGGRYNDVRAWVLEEDGSRFEEIELEFSNQT